MTRLDIQQLAALPDEAFIAQAWQALAGGEPPALAAWWLDAGASRSWVLLRLWALAGGAARGCRMAGGRVAGLANLAVRVPGGLRLLAGLLGLADTLSGRRAQRAALRHREFMLRFARIERLADTVDGLVRAQRLQQAQATQMGDDLNRRIDLATFEMRQVLDAAARRFDDRAD